jgi:hypothetical protein
MNGKQRARATLVGVVSLFAFGCNGTGIGELDSGSSSTQGDPNGPAACVAAGGHCICGPFACDGGVIGPQDCNPDRNPCGGVCCLPHP